ncbi:MAG: MFS transporter [Gammaproteobacteria bacterium]|nr:MFS transporter [Gammaproteobacteria bacterium]
MNHSDPGTGMTGTERRAVGALAAIFFLRMLGLFMVLPVLALYAEKMPGATPLLIGLSLGIYGLAQAGCQLPLGAASDRLGRKRVIIWGLGLFALGSATAALSHHIVGIILGRALQGLGAVSSPAMALAADLTRDSQRTKAMAIIGASIGVAFACAFVTGPLLDSLVGLSGVFWAAMVISIVAGILLITVVPNPSNEHFNPAYQPIGAEVRQVLMDRPLLPLNVGVFFLHCILAAVFVAIPVLLARETGVPADRHTHIYLPVLAVAFAALLPMMRLAHHDRLTMVVFRGAIVLIGLGLAAMPSLAQGELTMMGAMTLFFAGFCYLEASLPALISRLASPHQRGSALGIFATSQFAGAFAGGLLGGALAQWLGYHGICYAGAAMALIWLVVTLGMAPVARHQPA